MVEQKDGFNKFQWSGQYGGNMIVIRTNDKAEFDLLVTEYEKKVGEKTKPPMNTTEEKIRNFTKDVEASENLCPQHNVPMLKGFSKAKNKPYSYHDENGMRCFGKGYLPPKT